MNNSGYLNYVLDILSQFGKIKARKMFGAYGIYKDGVFFAIVDEDVLYFKANALTSHEYEAYGSKPLCYENKSGKIVSLGYWEVPADVIENSNRLAEWTKKAIEVAIKTKKVKNKRV